MHTITLSSRCCVVFFKGKFSLHPSFHLLVGKHATVSQTHRHTNTLYALHGSSVTYHFSLRSLLLFSSVFSFHFLLTEQSCSFVSALFRFSGSFCSSLALILIDTLRGYPSLFFSDSLMTCPLFFRSLLILRLPFSPV